MLAQLLVGCGWDLIDYCQCMIEYIMDPGGPSIVVRRPDSMTTLAPGRSTSTLVLGEGHGAEEEDVGWSCRRLIYEHYYGMAAPCPVDDKQQWPPLAEVVASHGSMATWLRDALPRAEESGVVRFEDCRTDLHLDMQGLPYKLRLVNAAWVSVGQFQQMKGKTETMIASVQNQVEQTIHKLKREFENGNLTDDLLHKRVKATEQWRGKKIADIQAHLDKCELAALVAIDKAAEGISHMWALFRDLGEKSAEMFEDDMAEHLFINELEDAMGNFSLDEAGIPLALATS